MNLGVLSVFKVDELDGSRGTNGHAVEAGIEDYEQSTPKTQRIRCARL